VWFLFFVLVCLYVCMSVCSSLISRKLKKINEKIQRHTFGVDSHYGASSLVSELHFWLVHKSN